MKIRDNHKEIPKNKAQEEEIFSLKVNNSAQKLREIKEIIKFIKMTIDVMAPRSLALTQLLLTKGK